MVENIKELKERMESFAEALSLNNQEKVDTVNSESSPHLELIDFDLLADSIRQVNAILDSIEQGQNQVDLVRRWFVMSVLTGRYSSSPESTIDYDIHQIHEQGIVAYADTIMQSQLSDTFWDIGLPQAMVTSVASSPLFRIFQAAQIKLGDRGFLSRDITVRELIEVKSDVHHLFPRDYLKKNGLSRGQYNQIANYVVAQSEINIAIGNKEPRTYFAHLMEQCNGDTKHYGSITSLDELHENLRINCIPDGMESMTVENYADFLECRRKLMAQKIKIYFEAL